MRCTIRFPNARSTAMHLAARAAGADMLGVLLGALSPEERAELINQEDRSGLTPAFLAYQR
jgi:hypothetical protein